MACIVMVDDITISRYSVSHASHILQASDEEALENGDSGNSRWSGKRYRERSLAWLPRMTAPCALARPATPLGPGPALCHKHMAFSIEAPCPHATVIAVRVKCSRLYI